MTLKYRVFIHIFGDSTIVEVNNFIHFQVSGNGRKRFGLPSGQHRGRDQRALECFERNMQNPSPPIQMESSESN
jgi:hypothetical protein